MQLRTIDRSAAIPYYYQLQEILKQELEDGRWPPGSVLPPEADLGNLFGVSRTVVRKALDILEGDGQIIRSKGRGTVVAQPKFRYEAIAAARQLRQGIPAETRTLLRILDCRRARVGSHVGKLLRLDPTDEVFEFVVVEASQQSPATISHAVIRMDASRALDELRLSDGVYPLIEPGGAEFITQLAQRYALTLAESEVTIEATRANQFEAEILQIRPDTPVFLLTSLHTSDARTPAIFARTVVRSDQFRFAVTLKHQRTAPH